MKKYYLIALLLTIAALPAIWKIQEHQDTMIREYSLLPEDFAEDAGSPPGVAISTIFLGPFRHLIVNALWLRMERLQKEGKFFEMVQLADWILQVQPENTMVAQYLAWNMAYNITVIQEDFDARRRWIRKAQETLRKAIAKNPNDHMLYREMAWIYQHKLGDELDKASAYYKWKLAEENFKILGRTHSPDWNALAAAPATWEAFYEKYPGMRTICRNRENELENAIISTGSLPDSLKINENNKILLTDFVRAQVVRNELLLEPAHAAWVEKNYGRLDWLLPDSFAIYWSSLGMLKTPGERSLMCERILTQSMKIMLSSGRIIFAGSEPGMNFIRMPNFDLLDASIASYKREADLLKMGLENSGYFVFLAEAIETLYLYGRKKEAAKHYREYQVLVPTESKDLTLDEFVNKRIRTKLKAMTNNQLQSTVVSFIQSAVFAFANGEHEEAEIMLATAESLYNSYLKEHSSEEEKVRLKLPPFKDFKRNVVHFIFNTYRELSPALKAELELQENYAPPVEK